MKTYATNLNNSPYYQYGTPVTCKRRDDITITVRVLDDEYPMGADDYLGKLTDFPRDKEWKIAVEIERENFPSSWEDSECYFIPSNPFKDRREWYVKNGYSRHEAYTLARKELMADYDLLSKFYEGDQYGESVIIVTVKYNGIELGSASCGGVLSGRDTDDSQETYEEAAFDLTRDAIYEALEAVQSLGGDATVLIKLDKAYGRLAMRRGWIQHIETRRAKYTAWRNGKCPVCGGSGHTPYSANERRLGVLAGFKGERRMIQPVTTVCPHCEGNKNYGEVK